MCQFEARAPYHTPVLLVKANGLAEEFSTLILSTGKAELVPTPAL